MRSTVVVLTLLLGLAVLATPAHAKPMRCAHPLTEPAAIVPGEITPPGTPVIHRVDFYRDGVSVSADFSSDTTRVEITFENARGVTTTLATTRDHLFVCAHDIPTATALVSVTAIDGAGNASAAVTTGYFREHLRDFRCHCGMGTMALLFIGGPVLLVVLAASLLIRALARRRKLQRPGAPVSPLAAEAITRLTIDRKLVVIAVSFAATLLLYFRGDPGWAVVAAWVPVTRVLHLIVLRLFLRTLERGAPAELHGNLLAANGRYIVVARRLARDVQAHSVPAAIDRSGRGRSAGDRSST